MKVLPIIIVAVSVGFSGCVVSKKKYEAQLLENSQLTNQLKKTKKENSELNTQIKGMTSDFEKMKNELHLSNAVKSDEVSDLLMKVTSLSDANEQIQNKLDETLSLYKNQKQTSQSITTELKDLKDDNYQLKRDTASIKYALNLSQERYKQLEKELNTLKDKYNLALNEKQGAENTLELNIQKLASFEKQLVQNKEKMDAISEAFISLRKEMLDARSSNKAIDPNKNKNIDKIARELGHY